MKDYQADITIIGAGVIGLAIAAQLARDKLDVYILEKNYTFGQETSSRNSQVIHAGIYYPEGSLKAKLCLEGNTSLYRLCEENGIGYRKTGKLIAATNIEEADEVEALLKRGKENGVEGLRMLSKREVSELEPNIKVAAAMLSPSTGIVDCYSLMKYFLNAAREKGAKIAFNSEVAGIERLSEGYKVTVKNDSESFAFRTRMLVNCAGLNSDKIARLAGIDIDEAGYKLYYCKGEYFSISSSKGRLISRLVYPVPEPNITGAGIHATLDLEGNVRLGPDARYVNEIDYRVDESQKDIFYQSAKRFLPFLEYEDLEPDMAGMRPKLQGPGESIRDFVIRHEYDRDLAGFINLVGIESPGLTSSPAIAAYVEKLTSGIL